MRRFLISLMFIYFWAAAQDAQPLEVLLESYLVTVVTLEDGTTEEQFTPSDSVRPGDVLEYRLVVTNTGNTTLGAGLVILNGPVPEGTSYLADSATPSGDSLRTEFSADGGTTFSEPPVLILVRNEQGEEEEVIAEPNTYHAIRWIVLDPLEPEATLTLRYRVRVE